MSRTQLDSQFDAMVETDEVAGETRFWPHTKYRTTAITNLKRLPSHWTEKCLKYLARINPDKLPDHTEPDYELEYVDISTVNLIDGITSTDNYLFDDAPSRARRLVQHGDTIVSTVRTYLKAVAQIQNPPKNLGSVSKLM